MSKILPNHPLEDRQSQPPLTQYVALLIRLHELMRGGNEEEAERVREQMDEPGLRLNEEEIQRVKGLSSDLYMLAHDELLRSSGYSQQEYAERFRSAWQAHDADTVLTLLRLKERPFPLDRVAYGRAKAYAWIGLQDVSKQFLLFASELAPENRRYKRFASWKNA